MLRKARRGPQAKKLHLGVEVGEPLLQLLVQSLRSSKFLLSPQLRRSKFLLLLP